MTQGWRLDPILFFANTLIAGAAVTFSIETYQLRAKVADLERPDAGVCLFLKWHNDLEWTFSISSAKLHSLAFCIHHLCSSQSSLVRLCSKYSAIRCPGMLQPDVSRLPSTIGAWKHRSTLKPGNCVANHSSCITHVHSSQAQCRCW